MDYILSEGSVAVLFIGSSGCAGIASEVMLSWYM